MGRKWPLLAAMVAALVLAVAATLASGFGSHDRAAAEAQTAARPEGDTQTPGSPGGGERSGVSMRPERGGSGPPAGARPAQSPPLGLTERVKDDIREARRGEPQRPADRPLVDVGALKDGPNPSAPALGTSFQGMADTGWFPPDHQIAAGPNNVLVATNGGVNIFSKRGTSLSSQTLGGFFSPLGAEHSGAFDPWAVYDPYINRFWLVAVSDDDVARSDILIGLSNTQDATLGWTMWELDATVNGGTEANQWCDYPKIGFDNQQIYVTCNMFTFPNAMGQRFFQYSKLRIMSKNQFVSNTGIFWWDFWDLREGASGTTKAFTVQPAQMFGASATEGGILANARGGGNTGSTLDVWRVTSAAECCDNDGTGPNLANQGHGVGSYDRSDGARQPGSTTQINNGDSRLLYAVWRNGRLSVGQTVACPSSSTDACGGFTELNVAGYPTISTLRNWALTAGGQDVYYPSVAVNGADDKTMVFTVSDSSLFPTAAYVGIPSITDCPGNPNCLDGGTTAFRFGQTTYVRLDNSGRNRWGDYSGAAPDPNGEGIWIVGEYTAATANTWGVQAGLTYQTSPPPANDHFNDSQFMSGTSTSTGGTNRYATWQVGEPGSSSTTHSVWYRWTAPFSGPVSMNTCTHSFDTVLAVYTGSAVNSLSQIASNDDSCGAGSRLTFNAVSGTTYRIQVRGFAGSEGTFTLGLEMPPPNDNFANARALSGNSATVAGTTLEATRETGEPDHYVTNPPDSDLWVGDHSVWYSWTAPFTGPVEANTCTSSIDSLLAVYTGSALNALTRIDDDNNNCPTGWGSRLTFNAVSGTTYRIAIGDAGGLRENDFTLRVIDRKPPRVTGTVPADNATGVARGGNVRATFSEAMRSGSINSNSFRLRRTGTTTNVGASVTYDAATQRATLDPNNPLQAGATYIATVTSGAKDVAGNGLDQDPSTAGNQPKTWRFRVAN